MTDERELKGPATKLYAMLSEEGYIDITEISEEQFCDLYDKALTEEE